MKDSIQYLEHLQQPFMLNISRCPITIPMLAIWQAMSLVSHWLKPKMKQSTATSKQLTIWIVLSRPSLTISKKVASMKNPSSSSTETIMVFPTPAILSWHPWLARLLRTGRITTMPCCNECLLWWSCLAMKRTNHQYLRWTNRYLTDSRTPPWYRIQFLPSSWTRPSVSRPSRNSCLSNCQFLRHTKIHQLRRTNLLYWERSWNQQSWWTSSDWTRNCSSSS